MNNKKIAIFYGGKRSKYLRLLREAGKKMGRSERHLRLLLERGGIKGKKLGHDWVVLDLNYTRKRKVKGGKK